MTLSELDIGNLWRGVRASIRHSRPYHIAPQVMGEVLTALVAEQKQVADLRAAIAEQGHSSLCPAFGYWGKSKPVCTCAYALLAATALAVEGDHAD